VTLAEAPVQGRFRMLIGSRIVLRKVLIRRNSMTDAVREAAKRS
jgi:hypothetical protein